MFPCLILLKDHADEPELVRVRIIPDVEQVLIFSLKDCETLLHVKVEGGPEQASTSTVTAVADVQHLLMMERGSHYAASAEDGLVIFRWLPSHLKKWINCFPAFFAVDI